MCKRILNLLLLLLILNVQLLTDVVEAYPAKTKKPNKKTSKIIVKKFKSVIKHTKEKLHVSQGYSTFHLDSNDILTGISELIIPDDTSIIVDEKQTNNNNRGSTKEKDNSSQENSGNSIRWNEEDTDSGCWYRELDSGISNSNEDVGCIKPVFKNENHSTKNHSTEDFDYESSRNRTFDTNECLKNNSTILIKRHTLDKRSIYPKSVGLWPNATIPYRIHSSVLSKELDIINSIKEWTSVISKLTFQRLPDNSNAIDYVMFFQLEDVDSCFSAIGRSGGKQPVHVGPSCFAPEITHELGHVLGLYHEHQRKDRDKYVKVINSNIRPNDRSTFKKLSKSIVSKVYDFNSIMHYRSTAFSVNGKPTLVSRVKNVSLPLENPSQPSALDIQTIKSLYKI